MTPRFFLAALASFAALAVPALAQQTPAAAPATQAFTVPPHNCVAPKFPSRPETTALRGDAYNKVIEAFNANYKAYGECIRKYVDDTKVWVKEVADSGNKAIDEYNKYTADLKEKIEAEKSEK
jgi:hypothetical protein